MAKLYLQLISRTVLAIAGTVFAYNTFTQNRGNNILKWAVVIMVLASVILNAFDRWV
jgi:hypothetical protein